MIDSDEDETNKSNPRMGNQQRDRLEIQKIKNVENETQTLKKSPSKLQESQQTSEDSDGNNEVIKQMEAKIESLEKELQMATRKIPTKVKIR